MSACGSQVFHEPELTSISGHLTEDADSSADSRAQKSSFLNLLRWASWAVGSAVSTAGLSSVH